MKRKHFNILEILLDFLIAAGVLLVTAFISIVISIAATGSREEGLGISAYLAIPLWTIVFYSIRRRFKMLVTTIQILISIGLTFLTGYILIQCITNLTYSGSYWIVLIPPFFIFVLTKHTMDNFITKYYPN